MDFLHTADLLGIVTTDETPDNVNEAFAVLSRRFTQAKALGMIVAFVQNGFFFEE